MNGARFQAAGWIPAALTDALNRIETACFTEPLNTAARRQQPTPLPDPELIRSRLADAEATFAAQVEALNTALKLNE